MKKIQGTSVEVTTSNLSRYVTRLKKALADEGITLKHTVAEKVFAKTFGSRNTHEFKALLSSLDANAATQSENSLDGVESAKLVLPALDKMLSADDGVNAEQTSDVLLSLSRNLMKNPFDGLNLSKETELEAVRLMKVIYKSSDVDERIKSFLIYVKRYQWLATGDPSLVKMFFDYSENEVKVKFISNQVEHRANMFEFVDLKNLLRKYPDNPYLSALFVGLFNNLSLFDSLQMKTKFIKRLPSLDVVFNKVNKNMFFKANTQGAIADLVSKRAQGRFVDMYSELYVEDVIRSNWDFDCVYIMRDYNYNPLCVLIMHPTVDQKFESLEIRFLKSGEVKVWNQLFVPYSDFSLLDEYTLYQLSQ